MRLSRNETGRQAGRLAGRQQGVAGSVDRWLKLRGYGGCPAHRRDSGTREVGTVGEYGVRWEGEAMAVVGGG